MKTFIIGGTGLIGSLVAEKLIKENHEVTSIALPHSSLEGVPKGLNIIYANLFELDDNTLLSYLSGFDNLVYAAGLDERIDAKPPIYDLFKKHNIDALERVLRLAKKTSIRNVSICGSYFTHFNRIYPELELTKHHVYIKSRVEQLEMALSYANNNFNVAVIELPYIFGIQEGRAPVWVFLVEIIKKMPLATFYSKGGTTMITANQAAEAVIGGLFSNNGGNAYPIGYYNKTWREFFKVAHKGLGYKRRLFITVPNFIFKIALKVMDKRKKKNNLEGGLDLVKYTKMQTKKLFIGKEVAEKLGVRKDNIDDAIIKSMELSLKVIKEKDKYETMKA